MQFNVPQFIDVEDKVAGPLTWKQLLWMIAMGASLMMIFGVFATSFAIIVAIPTVLLFIALAFYRPNGFPLSTFIFHGVLFLFRPKIAVWERPIRKMPSLTTTSMPQKREEPAPEKNLSEDKLHELARILDKAEKEREHSSIDRNEVR